MEPFNILQTTIQSESSTMINWYKNNLMQANPEKFQAICLGKETNKHITSFNIDNTNIPCEPHVKLLGITIDSNLSFDKHVSNICKKAARQINVLSRLCSNLNLDTRILIYKSFILSNFNYCPLVWHFCSKKLTYKLERLQYRALKIVFNDYKSDYDTLLDRIKMPSLHINRIKQLAIEIFKCLHNISPTYIQELINVKSPKYSFRNTNTLEIPIVNTTTYGKKSFRFEAPKIWNSLPNAIRCTTDYKEFQKLIKLWSNDNCGCSMCTTT